MCRWGFSNVVKTLKSVTDDRVRAYIVWLPIFGGDFKGEARKLSNTFRDKRVSYFLDPTSETGKQWERVLKTERFIAWDVYLLYGADANWENEPPQPAYWMHQLGGVTKAPTYDEPTFRAKLKGMLDDMKTPTTISPANGRAKVEFLYFKSCPGHKEALANLKAALQESKVNADIVLINVTTEAQAAKVGFQGSPSIRINGKDLDGRNEGHSYACRIYEIGGKITKTPSKEFIQGKLREIVELSGFEK
jgi:hypothetical protein